MFRGKVIEARPKDLEFASRFWELARGLLEEGRIKCHRFGVDEGGRGLEGVLKGLQLLRERGVSGRKLVYRVVD